MRSHVLPAVLGFKPVEYDCAFGTQGQTEEFSHRIGAARGAFAGILLGAGLWFCIIAGLTVILHS